MRQQADVLSVRRTTNGRTTGSEVCGCRLTFRSEDDQRKDDGLGASDACDCDR